jgi:hypothetical protein
MSDAYTRESQNNALLSSLSAKTTQLKHITLDIYDNARAQGTLDNTNEVFSSMGDGLRGSAGRLGRMARQVCVLLFWREWGRGEWEVGHRRGEGLRDGG